MRNLLIFPTVCLLYILPGCAKTGGAASPANPGVSSSLLVKSYQATITDSVLANTVTQYTVTYTFDNSNRMVSSSQSGTLTYLRTTSKYDNYFQFTYGTNTETETGTDTLGTVVGNTTTVFSLNASGYPEKAVITSINLGNSLVLTSNYIYDGNGYCTEMDNTSTYDNGPQPPTKSLFTISNGNVTEEDNYSSGNLVSSETFSYGSTANKTVLRFSTPPNAGHLNNDLVQSSLVKVSGTPTSLQNFTYTFDGQGRVTSGTATTSKGKVYLTFYNIQYLN